LRRRSHIRCLSEPAQRPDGDPHPTPGLRIAQLNKGERLRDSMYVHRNLPIGTTPNSIDRNSLAVWCQTEQQRRQKKKKKKKKKKKNSKFKKTYQCGNTGTVAGHRRPPLQHSKTYQSQVLLRFIPAAWLAASLAARQWTRQTSVRIAERGDNDTIVGIAETVRGDVANIGASYVTTPSI
jgi:hypothetical protein